MTINQKFSEPNMPENDYPGTTYSYCISIVCYAGLVKHSTYMFFAHLSYYCHTNNAFYFASRRWTSTNWFRIVNLSENDARCKKSLQ